MSEARPLTHVLSIDPGLTNLGWISLCLDGATWRVIACGCDDITGGSGRPDYAAVVLDWMTSYRAVHGVPNVVLIERQYDTVAIGNMQILPSALVMVALSAYCRVLWNSACVLVDPRKQRAVHHINRQSISRLPFTHELFHGMRIRQTLSPAQMDTVKRRASLAAARVVLASCCGYPDGHLLKNDHVADAVLTFHTWAPHVCNCLFLGAGPSF